MFATMVPVPPVGGGAACKAAAAAAICCGGKSVTARASSSWGHDSNSSDVSVQQLRTKGSAATVARATVAALMPAVAHEGTISACDTDKITSENLSLAREKSSALILHRRHSTEGGARADTLSGSMTKQITFSSLLHHPSLHVVQQGRNTAATFVMCTSCPDFLLLHSSRKADCSRCSNASRGCSDGSLTCPAAIAVSKTEDKGFAVRSRTSANESLLSHTPSMMHQEESRRKACNEEKLLPMLSPSCINAALSPPQADEAIIAGAVAVPEVTELSCVYRAGAAEKDLEKKQPFQQIVDYSSTFTAINVENSSVKCGTEIDSSISEKEFSGMPAHTTQEQQLCLPRGNDETVVVEGQKDYLVAADVAILPMTAHAAAAASIGESAERFPMQQLQQQQHGRVSEKPGREAAEVCKQQESHLVSCQVETGGPAATTACKKAAATERDTVPAGESLWTRVNSALLFPSQQPPSLAQLLQLKDVYEAAVLALQVLPERYMQRIQQLDALKELVPHLYSHCNTLSKVRDVYVESFSILAENRDALMKQLQDERLQWQQQQGHLSSRCCCERRRQQQQQQEDHARCLCSHSDGSMWSVEHETDDQCDCCWSSDDPEQHQVLQNLACMLCRIQQLQARVGPLLLAGISKFSELLTRQYAEQAQNIVDANRSCSSIDSSTGSIENSTTLKSTRENWWTSGAREVQEIVDCFLHSFFSCRVASELQREHLLLAIESGDCGAIVNSHIPMENLICQAALDAQELALHHLGIASPVEIHVGEAQEAAQQLCSLLLVGADIGSPGNDGETTSNHLKPYSEKYRPAGAAAGDTGGQSNNSTVPEKHFSEAMLPHELQKQHLGECTEKKGSGKDKFLADDAPPGAVVPQAVADNFTQNWGQFASDSSCWHGDCYRSSFPAAVVTAAVDSNAGLSRSSPNTNRTLPNTVRFPCFASYAYSGVFELLKNSMRATIEAWWKERRRGSCNNVQHCKVNNSRFNASTQPWRLLTVGRSRKLKKLPGRLRRRRCYSGSGLVWGGEARGEDAAAATVADEEDLQQEHRCGCGSTGGEYLQQYQQCDCVTMVAGDDVGAEEDTCCEVVELEDGVLPVVHVQLISLEGNLVIRIEDQGEGLPAEELQKIWSFAYTTAVRTSLLQRLVTAGNADCNEYEKNQSSATKVLEKVPPLAGCGVGLPMSRVHAQSLGGDIFLESVQGIGTCAYICLSNLQTFGDRSSRCQQFEGLSQRAATRFGDSIQSQHSLNSHQEI